ncbi:bacitracin transport permease protein BCRB [Gracilibacillus boraciitolerans JCM 21714]|uniref:Bacitracin transport permease protein BCRB n=1 Tax=Gracilibacillus boraciitolerans JCM 21714 TaxID=1298598 RepID=W4VQC0_9BACI|nr:ABC transporter permease [Gracilibacillus boraciitolerans]GAE94934.1 bacitracin transport permease protein BCRB [Gracilibacillus boraciitolerans JCM 21714]
MHSLIKLEIQKMNIVSLLLTFIYINAGIIGLFLLLGLDKDATAELLVNYESVFMLMEIFIVAAFVIYASVLLSHMIIEEFRDKTISVLFMYPINRTKLLVAKVLIVSIVTFFFIIFSHILVFSSFAFINSMVHYISDPLTLEMLTERALRIFLIALSSAGMALIPLFFGMRKYSVPATITSSILIIAVIFSSIDSTTNLYSFIAIPIFLGIIGFLIAYLVITKSVKADL